MSKTKQREKARIEARMRGLENELKALRAQPPSQAMTPSLNTSGETDMAKGIADDLMPIRKLQASVRADDGTEDNVRRILLMTIEEMARGQSHEGVIFGPLAVAGTWAAERLCERHELDDEYQYAVKHWLIGKWGEQIHAFDPDEFLAWNMERRERVRSETAFQGA